MFFRATYAAAPGDKIVEAVRRFGDAIRAEFGLDANGEKAVDGAPSTTNGTNGHANGVSH